MFFSNTPNQFEANKLLLDVIKKINTVECSETVPACGKIEQRELDSIEYLGGYCIKKAFAKFNDFSNDIKLLTSNKPNGTLITTMEKRISSLKIPSEDLLHYLQFVFLKMSMECQKPPTEINFFDVAENVLRSARTTCFYNYFCDLCDVDSELDDYFKIIRYIVKLFCKVLSHTFTKKLFSNIYKKNNARTHGLRKDLKQQSSSPN